MSPDRKLDWQKMSKKTLDVSGGVAARALKVATALALLTLTFGPLPDAPLSGPTPISEDDLFALFGEVPWRIISISNCDRPKLPEVIKQHRPFYLCQKLLHTFDDYNQVLFTTNGDLPKHLAP